ncbi:MAG: flippase-like domain-containing protein [Acidimicrobiales bacterium]|nr:flippase-like domain-containing protein [Acidimicrobiales bacterium]
MPTPRAGNASPAHAQQTAQTGRGVEQSPAPTGRSGTTRRDVADELRPYSALGVGELTGLAEAAEEPEPASKRRPWVLPIRILISLAMLAVLFWRIPDFEWSALLPDWHGTTLVWLAGALTFTLVAVVLSALRWQQVLRAMGYRLALPRLATTYFACQFVSNVLPTTIGGDVLRVSRISRDTEDAADAFASVVIERLTGWLVLPVITFTGFALNGGLRGLGDASSLAALVAVITLAGLGLILYTADHPQLGGRFASREGWRRFVQAVHLGVGRLRQRPLATLGVLGAGVAYQVVLCVAAWMAAEAMGMTDAGLTVILAFYPAVLILQVLPIGISGLGIREWALVQFLHPIGVPAEQAVALGLILYLLNLGASLVGAPAFAAGNRQAPAIRTRSPHP